MSDLLDTSGPGPESGPRPDVCGLDGLPLAEPDSLGLAVPVECGVVDLGTPEADLDGDGFMEAITLQDARGLTVYTDADGDGAVDHISTVRFDGSYDSWRLSNARDSTPFGGFSNAPGGTDGGSARWERTGFGHL